MNHILRIIGIAAQHKWWLVGAYASMAGAMVAYIMLPQYFGEAIDDISMVLETGEHPGTLKDMVTSPGGTTIEGLHELEAAGVRNGLMNAVRAAADKAAALG